MKSRCASCFVFPLLVCAWLGLGGSVRAAGVTLITHGQSGNVTGWVAGMADAVAYYPFFPGTNAIVYTARVSGSGTLSVSAVRDSSWWLRL